MKSLLVLAVVLSLGSPADNQCSTTSPSCYVPYQAPGLSLSCPGGQGEVKWRHQLRGQNYSLCSINDDRTCFVRGFEGVLSFDDSGLYYCVEGENKSNYINVTILGPPKLTNINNYPQYHICTPLGWRNQCRTNDVSLTRLTSLTLSVTWVSVAPANVTWFINDTEIHCPSSDYQPIDHLCSKITNTHNSSVITLHSGGGSLIGEYRAVVDNGYGHNTSITTVANKCIPPWPKVPVPETPHDVYFNGSGHVDLVGCRIAMDPGISQTVCYSTELDASWPNLNFSSCATCFGADVGGKCSYQLGNNNKLVLSTSIAECSNTISVHIRGTINESGVIFCAYDMVNYSTVHLQLVSSVVNWLYVGLYIASGVVCVVILLLLALLSLLGYKYRKRLRTPSKKAKRRANWERERERLVIKDKGGPKASPHVNRPHHPNYLTFPGTDSEGGNTDVPPEWHHQDLPTSRPEDV